MQKPNTKTTNQSPKTEFQNRVYFYTLKSLRFISGISVKDDLTLKIIVSQLIRSLTSIGANIIEAKASNSKKDFARYFDIALKSANETRYWLFLLKDLNKVDKIKVIDNKKKKRYLKVFCLQFWFLVLGFWFQILGLCPIILKTN